MTYTFEILKPLDFSTFLKRHEMEERKDSVLEQMTDLLPVLENWGFYHLAHELSEKLNLEIKSVRYSEVYNQAVVYFDPNQPEYAELPFFIATHFGCYEAAELLKDF